MTDQKDAGDQQPIAKVQADDSSTRSRTISKPGQKRPIVDYEDSDSNSRCSSQNSTNLPKTCQDFGKNLEPITEINSGCFGDQKFEDFAIGEQELSISLSSPISQNASKMIKLDLSLIENEENQTFEDFLDQTFSHSTDNIDPYQQSLQLDFAKSDDILGDGASGLVKKVFQSGHFSAIKQIFYDRDTKQQRNLNNAKHEISILRKIMDGPDENGDKRHIITMLAYDLEDPEAVYIKLELCDISLARLMHPKNYSQMNLIWTGRWELPSPNFTETDFTYFPLEEVTNFTGHILKGLAFLHANNIVHRDIKCENLLLTGMGNAETWVVKIADFGHSRIVDDDAGMFTPTGTVSHMAPEIMQLQSQLSVTSSSSVHVPRTSSMLLSDIWSLGCAITEMSSRGNPHYQTAQRPNARDILLYRLVHDSNNNNENYTLENAVGQIESSQSSSCDRDELINLVTDCFEMDESKRKSAFCLLNDYENFLGTDEFEEDMQD